MSPAWVVVRIVCCAIRLLSYYRHSARQGSPLGVGETLPTCTDDLTAPQNIGGDDPLVRQVGLRHAGRMIWGKARVLTPARLCALPGLRPGQAAISAVDALPTSLSTAGSSAPPPRSTRAPPSPCPSPKARQPRCRWAHRGTSRPASTPRPRRRWAARSGR